MGIDHIVKGLIIPLQCQLACSKVKDSINISLTSGSDIILFTTGVNLCKKKSVKPSFGPCIILVYDSVLFLTSSMLSQAFKVVVWPNAKMCSSEIDCHC